MLNINTYKKGNAKESNYRKSYHKTSRYKYYKLSIKGKSGVIKGERLLWIGQKGFYNIDINEKQIITLLK